MEHLSKLFCLYQTLCSVLLSSPIGVSSFDPQFSFPPKNGISATAVTTEEHCELCTQRCNDQVGTHCVKCKNVYVYIACLGIPCSLNFSELTYCTVACSVIARCILLQCCRHLIEFSQLSKNWNPLKFLSASFNYFKKK